MFDDTPNYASYSLDELRDVQQRVSREQFPDRYEKILAEIEQREASGEVAKANQQEARRSHDSRIRFGAVIGLSFSCLFVWLCARDIFITWRTVRWKETPCLIIWQKQKASFLLVAYSYQIEGQRYTHPLFEVAQSSKGKRRRWERLYPENSTRSCYVDPENSSQAVLRRGVYFENVVGALIALACVPIWLRTVRRPEDVDEKEETNPWKEPDV